MRVLHLFSNYKWTGPADPAISLVAALREQGVEAVLRSSGHTKGNPVNVVAERARERGLEPLTDLQLGKHRAPWRDWPDVRRLRRRVEVERIDLVHCHLPNDTRIAARALWKRGCPWVRTLYETEPERLEPADLERLGAARRVFVFSRRMRRELAGRGLSDARVVVLEPSVELGRFHPGREGAAATRQRLGFGEDDFLAGIVARVQPQRRFDLLLDVAEKVAREIPRFRLLVIGRGSRLEAVAREPARRRGLLDESVFFPGYFQGDDYAALLRALDVKLFLVPGTDGTARAVREALASGIPVLATRRGILPELVRDRVTGRVLEETSEAFAQALIELWRDPAARRRAGEAARRDAEARFDPAAQAARVAEVYGAVLTDAA